MKKLIFFALLLSLSLNTAAQDLASIEQNPQVSISNPGDRIEGSGIDRVQAGLATVRRSSILAIAKSMKFLKPEAAIAFVPDNVSDAPEIRKILSGAIHDFPQLVRGSYCDADFVGENLSFTQTVPLILDDLLYQIHRRFQVNFLVGEDISQKPINIRAGSIPWNTLLSSQLFLSGVRATCIDDSTIQLVSNDKLPDLQDTAEVKTEFIKLKFLQPFSGGNVDIAGRSNSQSSGGGQGCGASGGGGGGQSGGGGTQSCGNFEKLIIEIEKILGIRSARVSSLGGGQGGAQGGGGSGTENTEAIRSNRSVSVIPGRNILVVRATQEELDLIGQIIQRADRAPFQVIIRGLVYTANESKLRDIGVQTTLLAETADGRTSGGVTGSPVAANPLSTIFDFSTLIGTVDFNVQASALQTKGVISIKSRPFAMVIDGDTADLDVGRQIPVLIQSLNSLGNTPGTLEILEAGNILSVTPQVIDDDGGNAIGVNLNLQLESNDVDTSIVSQGVPSVNRRSIQTRLLINQETTVILGGFTVDSASRDTTKTPGLGDIPIIGNLFKRKVKRSELNRLYFAISVSVIPYGEVIKPDILPGADTDIPSVAPSVIKVEEELKKKTGN